MTLSNREIELFPPIIRSAYVYCDLVERLLVGDTTAPLFRIVSRMSDRGGENVQKASSPPLYIPRTRDQPGIQRSYRE